MASSHTELPIPFPTTEQASDAVQIVIEALTDSSAGHTARCVAGAVSILTFFGAGKMTEEVVKPVGSTLRATPQSGPMSKEECVAELQKLKDNLDEGDEATFSAVGAGAFPFKMVLEMLYQILLNYLP